MATETTGDTSPVMTEVLGGQGKSLAQALRGVPAARGADRLSPSTGSRWASQGVRLPDGRRVKLEAVRIGSRLLTTDAAVARFLAALNGDPPATTAAAEPRGPGQRRRASEAAGRRLAELGV